MRKKRQKLKTQRGVVAMAQEKEDTEEHIKEEIKDIKVKDIEAAKETDMKVDLEMRTWWMVMEILKPTIPTAMSPHTMQFSAVSHIASKWQ